MKKSENRHLEGRRRVPRQMDPPPRGDPLAESEVQGLEKQDLETHDWEKRQSEHYRDQTSRKILALCMWVLMVMVFSVIVGAVFTLGYHLLMPDGWHWLNPGELQDIKNFVLSGAVVGLGTSYMRRYLDSH